MLLNISSNILRGRQRLYNLSLIFLCEELGERVEKKEIGGISFSFSVQKQLVRNWR